MNRRVTQQDIASRLGLDKSTVSLALRSHPSIPARTRDKVKAVAEKLGYRPDPALATLARQRWAGHETGSGATLGYLVDTRMDNADNHYRFLAACRRRAGERGYRVDVLDLAGYPDIAAASRVLHHRGIRGLLVPQFEHMAGPGVGDLPSEYFTVVGLDSGWDALPFHVVKSDTFEETRLVWRETIARGYKRIGGAVLCHRPAAMDDSTRLAASLLAQQEWIAPRARLPLLTAENRDRDAFMTWFERHRPDAIVGFIPRVYYWLDEAGVKVPDEVAFASFTLVQSEFAHVTGCISQGEAIGSSGVDALIAAMGENEWGIPAQQRKLVLAPVWNEGRTLGAGPRS